MRICRKKSHIIPMNNQRIFVSISRKRNSSVLETFLHSILKVGIHFLSNRTSHRESLCKFNSFIISTTFLACAYSLIKRIEFFSIFFTHILHHFHIKSRHILIHCSILRFDAFSQICINTVNFFLVSHRKQLNFSYNSTSFTHYIFLFRFYYFP